MSGSCYISSQPFKEFMKDIFMSNKLCDRRVRLCHEDLWTISTHILSLVDTIKPLKLAEFLSKSLLLSQTTLKCRGKQKDRKSILLSVLLFYRLTLHHTSHSYAMHQLAQHCELFVLFYENMLAINKRN